MTPFEEYAALARELSTRQRGGEQAVAAEAARRRTLQTAVDQLGQRLAAQRQRLDQLGRAIGIDAPPEASPAPPGSPAVTGPGPVAATSVAPAAASAAVGTTSVPGGPGGPSTAPGGPGGAPTAPGGPGGAPTVSGAPGGPPGTGAAETGGAAAAPGRPGVGAYPQGGVPAPREGDPTAELAAARQLADEADRYGQEAEALAHRPVLLPTWSSPARAVAVYAACALAGSVLMLATLVGTPVPVGGLDLVAAGACAGVPLLSFVAGQFVLARWGRPVIGDGTPPSRYLPLGFVLCALLSSGFFCLYLVAFRLLR